MSKRIPFIAGNWKMYTTAEECVALCRAVRERSDAIAGVDKAVCPPFPFLERAREALAGSSVRLGAQNVHWDEQGAYTGEVSPLMLQGLVDYVIIGHSERRQYFCETNESVNRRLKAALAHGLTPIFCVGETQEEREAGCTEDVLTRQVNQGLEGVLWSAACLIAYEPVWAIGTGLAASGEQANETIGFVRGLVAEAFGEEVAQSTRIQYGGSVKPENASEFLSQPEIDGALVGGASLDADAFAAIVRSAAETKM
ncbi:MAG: triose-phosphate isomerase [Chloroflexi bacterium]|nr:triose-phosphate isomerase [Chloroflexota bacterium]